MKKQPKKNILNQLCAHCKTFFVCGKKWLARAMLLLKLINFPPRYSTYTELIPRVIFQFANMLLFCTPKKSQRGQSRIYYIPMMVLYICLEYKQWEGMLESSKINIFPFMTSKFHIEKRLLFITFAQSD